MRGGGCIEITIRSKLLYERSLLKLRFGHDNDDEYDAVWFCDTQKLDSGCMRSELGHEVIQSGRFYPPPPNYQEIGQV